MSSPRSLDPKRDIRLRRIGVAAFVTVFLALLVTAYGVVAVSTNRVRNEATSRVETTASVGGSVVQRELLAVAAVVDSFSRRPELTALLETPPSAARERGLRLNLSHLAGTNAGFRAAFITRLNGALIELQPQNRQLVGRSLAEDAWHIGLQHDAKGPVVSPVHATAMADDDLVVAVAGYVRRNSADEGRPLAIVGVIYRLDALSGIANELARAQGVELTVVDQEGQLVTDRGRPPSVLGRYDDRAVAGSITKRANLETIGWSVRADMSEYAALAPAAGLRTTVAYLTGAIAAADGVAAALIVWLLRRRRAAELARWQAEQRMTDIIAASHEAFISTDATGVILEWNKQAEALLGWHPDQAIGSELAALIVPTEVREQFVASTTDYIQAPHGAAGRRVSFLATHRDNSSVPVEMAGWISWHGSELRFSAFLHDMSERHRYEQELLASARTDPLTGVGNRLRMTEDLTAMHERFIRYGQTYSLAIVDVDFFKPYNDTYGHLAGDDALQRVAAELLRLVRGADAVYRFGGEEFVIVLPAQTSPGALIAAERLRTGIAALRLPHTGGPGGLVTVSVGVSTAQSGSATPDDTIRGADQALYEAKRAGRNRVACSSSIESACT